MVKHRHIADLLRAWIADGTLQTGEALPSEHALMSQFGVSRGTVRQAMAALRADQTIIGSRGKPPVVYGGPLTQPLSELIGFSAWVQALGMRPSSRVVSFSPSTADSYVAAQLAIAPGAPIYYLERVRYADDKPLMIERTSFVEHVGAQLTALDLDALSIYGALAERGIVFSSARHAMSAIPATRADARLLGVAPRSPLLRIERRAVSPSGEALEWSDDRYIGEQIVFSIENTAREASQSGVTTGKE